MFPIEILNVSASANQVSMDPFDFPDSSCIRVRLPTLGRSARSSSVSPLTFRRRMSAKRSSSKSRSGTVFSTYQVQRERFQKSANADAL